jgi:LPXTG-motif cell wall-anchored protein
MQAITIPISTAFQILLFFITAWNCYIFTPRKLIKKFPLVSVFISLYSIVFLWNLFFGYASKGLTIILDDQISNTDIVSLVLAGFLLISGISLIIYKKKKYLDIGLFLALNGLMLTLFMFKVDCSFDFRQILGGLWLK